MRWRSGKHSCRAFASTFRHQSRPDYRELICHSSLIHLGTSTVHAGSKNPEENAMNLHTHLLTWSPLAAQDFQPELHRQCQSAWRRTRTSLQTSSRPVSFVAGGDVVGTLQAITVPTATTAAGDIVTVGAADNGERASALFFPSCFPTLPVRTSACPQSMV